MNTNLQACTPLFDQTRWEEAQGSGRVSTVSYQTTWVLILLLPHTSLGILNNLSALLSVSAKDIKCPPHWVIIGI